MSNIISWSKWVDPLGRNLDDIEYVPEAQVKKPDNDWEDDNEEEEEGLNEHIPIVITPLGMIPLKPFNNPAKIFNFWLGETNFNISRKVAFIIKEVPGVEILDVFTRYKFRISVGNVFKFQDVRQGIEAALNAIPKLSINNKELELSPEIDLKVKQMIQLQLNQYKNWALYVFPNGQIDYTYSNDHDNNFMKKLDLYETTQSLVGGRVIKNESN